MEADHEEEVSTSNIPDREILSADCKILVDQFILLKENLQNCNVYFEIILNTPNVDPIARLQGFLILFIAYEKASKMRLELLAMAGMTINVVIQLMNSANESEVKATELIRTHSQRFPHVVMESAREQWELVQELGFQIDPVPDP